VAGVSIAIFTRYNLRSMWFEGYSSHILKCLLIAMWHTEKLPILVITVIVPSMEGLYRQFLVILGTVYGVVFRCPFSTGWLI
jgi:hypothetical protein